MASKIIYFTVNGIPERAEFPGDCPAQDLKGTKEQTGQFMKLRDENHHLFTGAKNSAIVAWRTILEKMVQQVKVSPLQAKKKWDNIKKKYKDCKYPGSGEGVSEKPTAATWTWFVLMDEMLGQRSSTTPPVLMTSIPEDTPGPSGAVDNQMEKEDSEPAGRGQKRKRDRDDGDDQGGHEDLFRSAAEAGPHDILKLYNPKGNIINISPSLEPNSPTSCYKLEVVAADYNSAELTGALGFNLSSMEKRLQGLEKKILFEAGETPVVVYEMKKQVDSFREKLENVEHLSWLGFFKNLSEGPNKLSPFYHKRTLHKTREECEHVREKFLQTSSLEVSEELRQYLKTPTFDNWQWEDAEIMVLLQVMYTDLDFIATFNIEPEVLQQFLFEAYRHYNNIPFHNFKHCFCVTQMMYGLIWLTDLKSKMENIDLLIMLTSAVCHDLDHTGYNNAYQINAQTELALRYNDISPLENHHCAVAFEILETRESNIFRNLSSDQYKRIREGIIKCILATDMTRHNEILNKFKSILSGFDFTNKEHKDLLMMVLIKVSDISNEARPMEVAEPWLDCLLQEFFNQSDMEKLEGLPVSPFMDRDKVTKPSSQIGFIRFVLLPLFIELANLFPCLEQHIIDPVRKALDYYTEMEKALDKEKQNWSQSESGAKNKEAADLQPEASKPETQSPTVG